MRGLVAWVIAAGVGLALLGQEVRGAAILEDHSSTWTAAGLNSTIARVQDNILPQDLFERVVEEGMPELRQMYYKLL
ncbi:hypothetical protein T484DRAFT_1845085 [Baffinella frigidus]|nr:hypothetical protein T484DRAFT_1845085 [Cryptophyta sp. CCMP2293]